MGCWVKKKEHLAMIQCSQCHCWYHHKCHCWYHHKCHCWYHHKCHCWYHHKCHCWYHHKCIPVPESEKWEELTFVCCAQDSSTQDRAEHNLKADLLADQWDCRVLWKAHTQGTNRMGIHMTRIQQMCGVESSESGTAACDVIPSIAFRRQEEELPLAVQPENVKQVNKRYREAKKRRGGMSAPGNNVADHQRTWLRSGREMVMISHFSADVPGSTLWYQQLTDILENKIRQSGLCVPDYQRTDMLHPLRLEGKAQCEEATSGSTGETSHFIEDDNQKRNGPIVECSTTTGSKTQYSEHTMRKSHKLKNFCSGLRRTMCVRVTVSIRLCDIYPGDLLGESESYFDHRGKAKKEYFYFLREDFVCVPLIERTLQEHGLTLSNDVTQFISDIRETFKRKEMYKDVAGQIPPTAAGLTQHGVAQLHGTVLVVFSSESLKRYLDRCFRIVTGKRALLDRRVPTARNARQCRDQGEAFRFTNSRPVTAAREEAWKEAF
ncbi:hypothetical protein Bbelb_283990 [Branchiostoma belcheri]|nr:hypothetical protein Bbelb_283990 [Branchiostoma belcheri]